MSKRGFLYSMQGYFGVEDRDRFLLLVGLVLFTLVFSCLLALSQVYSTDWIQSGVYSEGWMLESFSDEDWSSIELPFIGWERRDFTYYRGVVEHKGLFKKDVVIKVRDRALEVYVNGVAAPFDSKREGINELLTLDASLFNRESNLVAVSTQGEIDNFISIEGERENWRTSKMLLFFMATPGLLLLVLRKRELDSNKIALIVFLVVALVFMKPMLDNFNYWGGYDWDLTQSMNGITRQSILEFRQLPLWNPYFSGGVPLLADSQSTSLSPTLLLTILFDAVTGIKIQIILWTLAGLMGAYLLGRKLKIEVYSRYLLAFTFMFTSFYTLRITNGHVFSFTMYLIPWAFLFYLKTCEDKKYSILCGLVLALMIYGGGVYTFISSLMLIGLHALGTTVNNLGGKKSKEKIRDKIICLGLILLFFFTLGAVKIVPLIKYSMTYSRSMPHECPCDNSRETMICADVYMGYQPRWLSYAVLGLNQKRNVNELPCGIWYEYGVYVGPIVLLLALGGIIFYFKKNWPLLLIIIFTVLIVKGVCPSEMPLWALLHKLPLLASLRYPSRFILVALLPTAILAGRMSSRIEEKKKWIALVLAVLVFYNLLLVNSPTLEDAFKITPRAIEETKFTQRIDQPQLLFVYSESYLHFLGNQGVVNDEQQLSQAGLSGRITRADAIDEEDYGGETYTLGVGESSLASFSPNRLVVKVDSKIDNTVVVNQDYMDGWKSPQGVVYNWEGLMAINVEAGTKEVLLYYSPASFKLGLIITLLTIFLIARYFTLKKKNRNKVFLNSLKETRTILIIILVLMLCTRGVDLIQSSGLYTENPIYTSGPEVTVEAQTLLLTPLLANHVFYTLGK